MVVFFTQLFSEALIWILYLQNCLYYCPLLKPGFTTGLEFIRVVMSSNTATPVDQSHALRREQSINQSLHFYSAFLPTQVLKALTDYSIHTLSPIHTGDGNYVVATAALGQN